MKTNLLRSHLIFTILALFLVASLGSCSANKPQSAWMDVKHARELDHNKGNRSKHVQKNYAKVNHY